MPNRKNTKIITILPPLIAKLELAASTNNYHKFTIGLLHPYKDVDKAALLFMPAAYGNFEYSYIIW